MKRGVIWFACLLAAVTIASLQVVLDNLIHRLEIPPMIVALTQSPDDLQYDHFLRARGDDGPAQGGRRAPRQPVPRRRPGDPLDGPPRRGQ